MLIAPTVSVLSIDSRIHCIAASKTIHSGAHASFHAGRVEARRVMRFRLPTPVTRTEYGRTWIASWLVHKTPFAGDRQVCNMQASERSIILWCLAPCDGLRFSSYCTLRSPSRRSLVVCIGGSYVRSSTWVIQFRSFNRWPQSADRETT